MSRTVLISLISLAVLGTTGAALAGPGNHELGQGTDVAVGIPDDNPVHEPDDNGICEKGETTIRVGPNGQSVNVPCHAGGHDAASHGIGQANGHH